jgi:hypothetical protein
MHERCPKGYKVSIAVNADSKDIESENYKELEKLEIPVDTYSINLAVDTEETSLPWENPIQITIDMQSPKKSRIRVRGNETVWVKTVSSGLVQEFEKKKLMYRHIAKYEPLRLISAFVSSALLMTVLGFALLRLPVEPSIVFIVVAVLFYGVAMLLKRFFDWVFPYFEIDSNDFKPRKFRKATLGLLWGSGIIGIFIEWVLRALVH